MRRAALMVIAVASALPAASLTYLVPKSDAIVVGSLAGQMHSVGVRAYSFRLLVERTLTGSLSGGSVIDVTFSSAHQTWGPGTLADTSRGIWFLQQSSDGKWSCLPASSHGNLVLLNELSLPITSEPLPAELPYEPATTSVADQIVYELAAAPPRDPSDSPRYLRCRFTSRY